MLLCRAGFNTQGLRNRRWEQDAVPMSLPQHETQGTTMPEPMTDEYLEERRKELARIAQETVTRGSSAFLSPERELDLITALQAERREKAELQKRIDQQDDEIESLESQNSEMAAQLRYEPQ